MGFNFVVPAVKIHPDVLHFVGFGLAGDKDFLVAVLVTCGGEVFAGEVIGPIYTVKPTLVGGDAAWNFREGCMASLADDEGLHIFVHFAKRIGQLCSFIADGVPRVENQGYSFIPILVGVGK